MSRNEEGFFMISSLLIVGVLLNMLPTPCAGKRASSKHERDTELLLS